MPTISELAAQIEKIKRADLEQMFAVDQALWSALGGGLPQGPTPFEHKCRRLLFLITEGYEDAAGALAREIATEAYDEYLDRCRCDVTGNVYFHSCLNW